MAGCTKSNDGDIRNAIGYGDYFLSKLDRNGNMEWQKCLGGSSMEFPLCVQVTKDGGYIVSGYSYSNDKDVSGNHGYSDAWIVKLNKSGVIEWQKCFGGFYNDCAYSIIQTSDGGYAAAGYTDSRDGDLNGNYGKSDLWVIKLDAGGHMQWQERLGGSEDETAHSLAQSKDGSYIVAGYTMSDDNDIHHFKGDVDAWLVKLSSTGYVEWEKTFGGSGVEYAYSVKCTIDGGYVFTGMTTSNNGDISKTYGNGDLWIVKLDKQGEMQWNKVFGGSSEDIGLDIIQTHDSSYVASGSSGSNDEDLIGKTGAGHAWILGVSKDGKLSWQKCLGGAGDGMFYSVKATDDHGLVAAGFTSDRSANNGVNQDLEDFFIAKLSYDQLVPWIPNAFTPNGDGLNDVWNLSFLASFAVCKVEVFDRWGQKIFSSNGYQKAWDGTYKGKQLPGGVYSYVICTAPGLKTFTGTVVLLR